MTSPKRFIAEHDLKILAHAGDEFFAAIFEGVEELAVVPTEDVDSHSAETSFVFTSPRDEFKS